MTERTIAKLLAEMPKLTNKELRTIYIRHIDIPMILSGALLEALKAIAQAQRELLLKEGWRKVKSAEEIYSHLCSLARKGRLPTANLGEVDFSKEVEAYRGILAFSEEFYRWFIGEEVKDE